MPKIFFRQTQFYSRGSTSMREHEYEQVILKEAPKLFPDILIRKFKYDLDNGLDIRRPDLIFFKKDLTSWGFIEVELSHHDIYNHILPQITVISDAPFPEARIKDLSRSTGIDSTNLRSLIKFEPPKNYIIIDKQNDLLKRVSEEKGFRVCIFEIFESLGGEMALRINGQPFPEGRSDEIFPLKLTVKPGILRGNNIPDIDRIIFSGAIFDCEVSNKEGKSWLIIHNLNVNLKPEVNLVRSSIKEWILMGEIENGSNTI